MSARDKSRFTTAQAGWIALAIFGGWLVFLLLPHAREVPSPAGAPALLEGEEELRAAGLRYNADWVGLPTYFAAWSSRVSWVNDKFQFGYWNPGVRGYTYHFEATRTSQGVRFALLSDGPATDEVSRDLDENGMLPTHPFDFAVLVPTEPFARTPANPAVAEPAPPVNPAEKPKVEVQMSPKPFQVPDPVLKTDDAGKN